MLSYRTFSVLILGFALMACDKQQPSEPAEDIKEDASTQISAESSNTKKNEDIKKTYVFRWLSEGEYNKPERTVNTTIYELKDDVLTELGTVKDTILVHHDKGLTAFTLDENKVKGCGACNESDPVAACKKDPSLLTDFEHPQVVVELPDHTKKSHSPMSAPSPEEAIAFHRPSMEYHGQLGPYLFVTYKLEQMPCYAAGNNTFTEYVTLDAATGEPVELLKKDELENPSGDVAISAIGQAEAMYEGFDGKLKLTDVIFTLDGSTPNALYVFDSTCGEPCSGMVGQNIDVTVDLPSVILPKTFQERVQTPPKAVAKLLDAPNPKRQGQGWSMVDANAEQSEAIQKFLK